METKQSKRTISHENPNLLLAAWLGTAEGGVLRLAEAALQPAAPPPLLDDVLPPEPGDSLVVLALLVEAGAEHETEEVGTAVAVLVQRPESQAGARGLGRSVAQLVRRSDKISGFMDPPKTPQK